MPTRASIEIGSQLAGDRPNASFASLHETRYRTPFVNDDERGGDQPILVRPRAFTTA
jgi:hypothetical protein